MRFKFAIGIMLIGLSVVPNPAFGLAVPFLGWGYSVGYGIGWLIGLKGNREGHAWSTVFDPPADVLRGRLTIAYDPSLVIIHPEASGFLGDFSTNPATAIPFNPSGVYGDLDLGLASSPRPGMTSSLVVGPNTVTLDFDLTANPVTVASESDHVNFFSLGMESIAPLAGWTVEPTSIGQLRELGSPADTSQTFMVCGFANGESLCGETTTLGLTARFVPEPSTLALMVAGICVCSPFLRRRNASRA